MQLAIHLNLWVKNKFDIDGTAPITAADSSKILTYLDPQLEEIRLAGNIDGKVLLYGPETTFTLTGNASINGAIIADNITSTGSFEISIKEEDILAYESLFINETMGASRFKSMWSSK